RRAGQRRPRGALPRLRVATRCRGRRATHRRGVRGGLRRVVAASGSSIRQEPDDHGTKYRGGNGPRRGADQAMRGVVFGTRRGSTRQRSAGGLLPVAWGLGVLGVVVLVALAGPARATTRGGPRDPLPTTCSLPVTTASPGAAVSAGIEHVAPGT